MFRSKKSSSPQVSPLAAPTPPQQQYSQQPYQQHRQSVHGYPGPTPNQQRSYPFPPPPQAQRQGSYQSSAGSSGATSPLHPPVITVGGPPYGSQPGSGGMTNGAHGGAYQQGPGYSGQPVGRSMSRDTTGTGGASVKEGKRKSFFGFGRKKDKDKVKDGDLEPKHEQPRPRPNSFIINREETGRYPGPSSASPVSPNDNQHVPYGMHQFPPSREGAHPIPQGLGRPGAVPQAGRIVSQPPMIQQPGRGNDQQRDFDPQPDSMTKSQSLGHFGRTGGGMSPPLQDSQGRYPGAGGAAQDERRSPSNVPVANGNMPRSATVPHSLSPPPAPASDAQQYQPASGPARPTSYHGGSAPAAGPPAPAQSAAAPGPDSGEEAPPAWMREFDTIVELFNAQPQKTYVASPPELEMILARTSAGGQPKQGQPGSKTNDWDAIWLQLSGISLSMWSMKETRAAAAKGEKVPPTYFNLTDSSLELLAALPPPPHRPNSHPHHFVFSLNTAGSNRLLFSCQTERDLARWATGMRLAAWERARLEEIYTGHLIKSGGREPRPALRAGRLEGWVRVRVMGGVEWKRLWLVLSRPASEAELNQKEDSDNKKGRRKSFFGISVGGSSDGGADNQEKDREVVQEPNTGLPMASFYAEPRTAKNRTTPAVLTLSNVTQAYAVFPERLEVMAQSNLMKAVGRIGGDMVTIEGRLRDSGWALIMPEGVEGEDGVKGAKGPTPLANMMKWVTGFHDAFALYGRPERYSWDTQDPRSLFFAYPSGVDQSLLFLNVDEAVAADFRISNLAAIRRRFVEITQRKMILPAAEYADNNDRTEPQAGMNGDYRLPPLSFDSGDPRASDPSVPRSLTPITERTDIASRNNSQKTSRSTGLDRRISGSGGSSSVKQNSGGSTKHPSGDLSGGERLPVIRDSSENISHFTDEPEQTEQLRESGRSSATDDRTPTLPAGAVATAPLAGDRGTAASKSALNTPTATMESFTAQSVWSQETGVTPTGPSPAAALPAASVARSQGVSDPPVLADGTAGSRDPTLPATAGASHGLPSAGPLLAPPVDAPAPVASPAQPDAEVLSPTPRRVASGDLSAAGLDLNQEPAARYLMIMVDEPPALASNGRPKSTNAASTTPGHDERASPSKTSPSRSRPTIVTNFDQPSTQHGTQPPPQPMGSGYSRTQENLGRKPSGARAPPPPRKVSVGPKLNTVSPEPDTVPEETTANGDNAPASSAAPLPRSETHAELGEDAATYVQYAENQHAMPAASPPAAKAAAPAVQESEQLRSSFAPSKAAAERRAKAEAAAQATQRAMALPGAGRRVATSGGGNWSGSEDEEEEDEVNSPVAETSASNLPPQPTVRDQEPMSASSRLRALPPVPRNDTYRSSSYSANDSAFAGQGRPDRAMDDTYTDVSSLPRPPAQPYAGPGYGSRSTPPPPAVAGAGNLPQSRSTVWNANFAAEHGMPEPAKSSKFVELEDTSAQLTRAFAPHGLLQAGIQDKEERSAKKQEELARELGSSLINVPSKPPPPQTGLLGAVAQHEKSRQGAGGIGAALTDREREKRLAEERARDLERMQRQQMDHFRQSQGPGSDYAAAQQQYPFGMGMPMMGIPSPMGPMPPMGYNPYQGYNAFAQQQAMMAAQMAYHSAMASMSQHGGGGSQYGGAGSGGGVASPDRPASPASMMGGAPHGYDPRMSMGPFGWPGMPGGGMPGMPSYPSMSGLSSMAGMPGMPGQGAPWQQYNNAPPSRPDSTAGGLRAGTPGGEGEQSASRRASDAGHRDASQERRSAN